jgi:hypothetical protein
MVIYSFTLMLGSFGPKIQAFEALLFNIPIASALRFRAGTLLVVVDIDILEVDGRCAKPLAVVEVGMLVIPICAMT